MRKGILTTALLLAGSAGFIASCGGGGSSLSSGDSSQQVSRTAEVVVSAKFPGGSGGIRPAYIDENVSSISIVIYAGCTEGSYNCTTIREATLTRDNPSATIPNLPVGAFRYSVIASDSSWRTVDYLAGGGTLAEGRNSLTATLIRAKWSFVDSNNNPVSISLNKTLSSSQETISHFVVLPYTYGEFYWTRSGGFSFYDVYYFGSGLNAVGCSVNSCGGYNELTYFNSFMGPNSSRNALEGAQLPLIPDPNYPDTYDPNPQTCWRYGDPYDCTNRSAVIVGLPFNLDYGYGYGYGNQSIRFEYNGQDITDIIENYLNEYGTKVTAADTMRGLMLELLFKQGGWQYTCYDVNGVTCNGQQNCEITCPIQFMKASKKKMVMKALSERIGKAQLPECYRNLRINRTDEWTTYWDLNNDYSPDPVKIRETLSATIDVCFHQFRAKASQIPQTDLQLIIQKK